VEVQGVVNQMIKLQRELHLTEKEKTLLQSNELEKKSQELDNQLSAY